MTTSVDLVRGFRHLRALVIGDVMLDSYLYGNATRLCSEGPVPVVRKTTEMHAPGGAANTAVNLRAMGAQVDLVGVVGNDAGSRLLRDALEEGGVHTKYLVDDPEVNTLHKQRILSNDQYVVRFDCGETRTCSPRGHEQLLQYLTDAFEHCDLVVISDYRYGVLSDELLDRLHRLRTERFCPLIVDSKDLLRFRSMNATAITPNHLEAQLAVDSTSRCDGPVDVSEMAGIGRQLTRLIDAEHIVITMAENGVILVHRDGETAHLPAHAVGQANDVGAGDSFTAAFSLALAGGGMPVQAARIGLAAGSIAVTQPRTAIVRQQELLQRIGLDVPYLVPCDGALRATLNTARAHGNTVVFTNGVFDIMHAGHVHFLRQARTLGDLLVVGINSDASARRLKGRNRPINNEADRMALVAALEPVDHVVLFDEDTPVDLIRTIRPDIHVKGGDYTEEQLPEAEAVRGGGGRVVILPLHQRLSTSAMIDRIVALALQDSIGVGS